MQLFASDAWPVSGARSWILVKWTPKYGTLFEPDARLANRKDMNCEPTGKKRFLRITDECFCLCAMTTPEASFARRCAS